jgi:hypothetical protein
MGSLSANATILSHQPKTCMEPVVGHVVACTCHWPYLRYHEHGVGGIGYVQQIWLLFLPRSERGRTLSVKMEREDLHQWGSMTGTPSTPKKEYVNSSCGGIFYSYVEHMEGSHPMYVGSWICTCTGHAQSFC